MKCPFCSSDDTQVKDSRGAEDGAAIRRRRVCHACEGRFTTFERVQLRELTVVKGDGRREAFDRDKLSRSFRLCLQKRPVDLENVERVVTSIVRRLESAGDAEVSSNKIGAMAMEALANIDPVGYVRYASVYKNFREVGDFNEFLGDLKKTYDKAESV
ncbi:MAG: transcriptional regulator NrdR [Pseudomonadota bacterium]